MSMLRFHIMIMFYYNFIFLKKKFNKENKKQTKIENLK